MNTSTPSPWMRGSSAIRCARTIRRSPHRSAHWWRSCTLCRVLPDNLRITSIETRTGVLRRLFLFIGSVSHLHWHAGASVASHSVATQPPASAGALLIAAGSDVAPVEHGVVHGLGTIA